MTAVRTNCLFTCYAHGALLVALTLVAPVLADAAPALTGLDPSSGSPGATVTIAGHGFGSMQSNSTVTFNGVTAVVATWSATSIGVSVPVGATSGDVVVRVDNADSNGLAFTVIHTPQLTGLAPDTGAPGAVVTLTGSHFGGSQGTSTVTFNGVAGAIVSWSDAAITTAVPTGASSGSVVVRVNGYDSSGLPFGVLPAPTVTSVSPTAGSVGSPVFISGAHFGATQGSGQVMFNGLSAPVVSWADTQINAIVPPGALAGAVSVFANGAASNGMPFAVAPAPALTSLSPATAPVGSTVVVSGAHFGASQAGGTVRFGMRTATVTQWTDSSITATVPPGGSGAVIVRAGGVTSNGLPFTLLTTLSEVSGEARGARIGYTGRVNATFQRPERDRLAPRGLEVQMAWYHSGTQLFAVDRFLISDLATLPTSGLHDAVVTTVAPPWRVVITTRESLGEVPPEGAFVSCNSDRPYPGQPACTTDELPSPTGAVIGLSTSEFTVAAIP